MLVPQRAVTTGCRVAGNRIKVETLRIYTYVNPKIQLRSYVEDGGEKEVRVSKLNPSHPCAARRLQSYLQGSRLPKSETASALSPHHWLRPTPRT